MSKFESKRGAGKRKAVALRYRAGEDMAPVVIASGYGTIADKIIGIGEERGVPIYKDDSAASMLCMLEVGRSIPADLYEVIAAVYMQILLTAANAKESSAAAEGSNTVAQQLRQRLQTGSRPQE